MKNFKKNLINQATYDDYIHSLTLSDIPCPYCNQVHSLIHHANYTRSIKVLTHKVQLSIHRVLCTKCRTTHALLPSFIVPYSQIDTSTMISIVFHQDHHSVLENNPLLELSNIRYILKQYNLQFKSFLSSFSSEPLIVIIQHCFYLCF